MKTSNLVKIGLLALSLALIPGCSSNKKNVIDRSSVNDDLLLQAADDIKQELKVINRLGSGGLPQAQKTTKVQNGDKIPRAFKRNVSIDFDGDIDLFMRDLKRAKLFDVRIVGQRPTQDIIISLHHKDQPLWKVLEDAGIQIGRFGVMSISSNTLLLNYEKD